jgi:hypothetical protein
MHIVACGEDFVAAEHDDGTDVVAPAEIGCRRDDFAIQLTAQSVAGRAGQQQRRDAGLVIAGVDGDELSHELST